MKIVKYKKLSRGRYQIFFDDGTNKTFYEDVIFKYQLLLKKELSDKEQLDIAVDNLHYEVYYVALASIQAKFKSIWETRGFLLKRGYDVSDIDTAIEKLVQQGYLNDQIFARSYVNHQLITTTKGPNKIIQELSDKHVSMSIILDEISVFSQEQQAEKIRKLVEKQLKRNSTRAGVVLRKKLIQDLSLTGYEYDMITSIISEFDLSPEQDIVSKEYQKQYRRLSRKYEGRELEQKIREKLFQKGFVYDGEI